MRLRPILLSLLLSVALVAQAAADMLEKRDLTIVTAGGPQRFVVELAKTR